MRGGAWDVAVYDYYAYVSATGQTFPQDLVLDVGDPYDLRLAGPFGGFAPKEDVAIAGAKAFASHNVFLSVFDLTDPAYPIELQRLDVGQYALGIEPSHYRFR